MDLINILKNEINRRKVEIEDNIVNNKEEANTDQFKCQLQKVENYISQLQT